MNPYYQTSSSEAFSSDAYGGYPSYNQNYPNSSSYSTYSSSSYPSTANSSLSPSVPYQSSFPYSGSYREDRRGLSERRVGGIGRGDSGSGRDFDSRGPPGPGSGVIQGPPAGGGPPGPRRITSNFFCYYCGKAGHIARNCWYNPNRRRRDGLNPPPGFGGSGVGMGGSGSGVGGADEGGGEGGEEKRRSDSDTEATIKKLQMGIAELKEMIMKRKDTKDRDEEQEQDEDEESDEDGERANPKRKKHKKTEKKEQE